VRLEIKKTADPDHQHTLRVEGGDGDLFRAEPGRSQGAKWGHTLMILLRVAL